MQNAGGEKTQFQPKFPQTLGLRLLQFSLEQSRRLSGKATPRFQDKTARRFGSVAWQAHSAKKIAAKEPLVLAQASAANELLNTNAYKKRVAIEQREMLPQGILKLFSNLLKLRLPSSVQVHQGNETDKWLLSRHADAMTLGREVYFRKGRFDLKSARGLGLLGHELTHVAQQEPDNWRNPYLGRRDSQSETQALRNERLVLANARSLAPQSGGAVGVNLASNSGARAATMPASRAMTPMYADASRDVGAGLNSAATDYTAPTLSAKEMRRIKDEVYKDIMMKIKIEFERGA